MRAPHFACFLARVLAVVLLVSGVAQAQTLNVNPAVGPVEGGTILRISAGGNPGNLVQVRINGVPLAFERAAEYLRAVAPPHAAGVVQISVETTGGTILTRDFEYREWPTTGLATPIDRVSLSSAGLQLDGYNVFSCGAVSGGGSADGRFVSFSSDATDTGFSQPATGWTQFGSCGGGPVRQIYVRDRVGGTLEHISRAPGGGPAGDRFSTVPSVSASGEWVGFISQARNLLDGTVVPDAAGLNVQEKAFLHHRPTGLIERIDVDTDGTPGNHNAAGPLAISADGSIVAFISSASNLATAGFPADGATSRDVFVRNRTTGVTERWTANANTSRVSLSDDGRFLVFVTTQQLDPADTNAFSDAYLIDRHAPTPAPTLVTVGANASTTATLISRDGQTVALGSNASNLVPDDTNGVSDVFTLDRATGAIRKVTVTSGGEQLSTFSTLLAISGNGQRVAFNSPAAELGGPLVPALSQPWVHDRVSGDTMLLTAAASGLWGTNPVGTVDLSSDGRIAFMTSLSPNLVPGDTNLQSDAFVKQLPPDTPVGAAIVVSPFDIASSTSPVTVTFAGVTAAGDTSLEVLTSGPALPAGFAIGNPARYFEITTTASYAGAITVCINYSGIDVGDESTAELLHHDGTAWSVVTTSRDVDANVICGETTSLSPFVIAQPQPVVSEFEVEQVQFGPATHKAGSAVPIRIRVLSGDENVSGAALPVTATGLRRVGDSSWGPVSAPGKSNPDMRFQFTSVQGAPGYQLVVKTTGLSAGTWEMRLQVGDSTDTFTVALVLR